MARPETELVGDKLMVQKLAPGTGTSWWNNTGTTQQVGLSLVCLVEMWKLVEVAQYGTFATCYCNDIDWLLPSVVPRRPFAEVL
jgi:hypothetical protein